MRSKTCVAARISLRVPVLCVLAVLADVRCHQASLNHFVSRLCDMFDESTAGARWFLVALAYKTQWLKRVMFQCPDAATRKAFSRLVVVRCFVQLRHRKWLPPLELRRVTPVCRCCRSMSSTPCVPPSALGIEST